jgi:hypothetical protein
MKGVKVKPSGERGLLKQFDCYSFPIEGKTNDVAYEVYASFGLEQSKLFHEDGYGADPYAFWCLVVEEFSILADDMSFKTEVRMFL